MHPEHNCAEAEIPQTARVAIIAQPKNNHSQYAQLIEKLTLEFFINFARLAWEFNLWKNIMEYLKYRISQLFFVGFGYRF